MEEWTQAQRFRNKLSVAGFLSLAAIGGLIMLYCLYLLVYPSEEPEILKWLEARVSVQFIGWLAIMFLVWSLFDRLNQIEKALTGIKEELKKRAD